MVPASAHQFAPFSADVLPTCAPAGSSATFTATIRNEASLLRIGSVNVTPPAGFTITGIASPPTSGTASFGPTVLRLRSLNLQPGGSVSIAFQATTPAAGAYRWHDPSTHGAGRIQAKHTKFFTGPEKFRLDPGRSLLDALVGVCELAFTVPPASAELDANVSGAPVDPDGAPVAVEVRNGPGGPVVATFDGPVSLSLLPPDDVSGAALTPTVPTADLVAGVAAFAASAGDGFSIAPQGVGYRVVADAGPSVAPATSGPFDIVNDGVICEGAGCSAEAADPGGSVEVTAPDAEPGDVITLALNVEELDCPGYVPLAGTPIVTFSVTGDSIRIITIRIPAALATRPAKLDRVCYGSELAFVDKHGVTTNVGVLPACSWYGPLVPPCQLKTRVDWHTGDHIVSFVAPPGSTRGRT
jgi:hypothetical protein